MQIGKIIKIEFTQPPRFFISLFTTLFTQLLSLSMCMHVFGSVFICFFMSFGLFYFNDNKCCSFSVELVEQTNAHSHAHTRNHTNSLLFLYKLIKSIVASICAAMNWYGIVHKMSTCSNYEAQLATVIRQTISQ